MSHRFEGARGRGYRDTFSCLLTSNYLTAAAWLSEKRRANHSSHQRWAFMTAIDLWKDVSTVGSRRAQSKSRKATLYENFYDWT